MKILAVILLSLVGLYVFFVLFLYLFQEQFIMHPKKLPSDLMYDFKYPHNEYTIDVKPGVSLNAVHFPLDDSKGVVLYFHGNTGELDVWGTVSDDFLKRGYEVFLIDYRGYGKSTGKVRSESDLHEDAEAAYQYLKELVPEKPVVIYGRSLGSGVAAHLAVNHQPQALVLETPYNNMLDVVDHHTPWFFPNKFILKYRLATDQILKDVQSPVYAIHGTKDPTIPYELAEKLTEAGHADLKFIQVSQAQHNNLIDYMEFGQMLDEVLGPEINR